MANFQIVDTDVEIKQLNLDNGKCFWGPAELDFDVEQHILSKAQELVYDRTEGETVQTFDPPEMTYQATHAFLRSSRSGWNLVDGKGKVMDRTKPNIDNPKIVTKDERKAIGDFAVKLYFPEMFEEEKPAQERALPGPEADEYDPFGKIDDSGQSPIDQLPTSTRETVSPGANGSGTSSTGNSGSSTARRKAIQSQASS